MSRLFSFKTPKWCEILVSQPPDQAVVSGRKKTLVSSLLARRAKMILLDSAIPSYFKFPYDSQVFTSLVRDRSSLPRTKFAWAIAPSHFDCFLFILNSSFFFSSYDQYISLQRNLDHPDTPAFPSVQARSSNEDKWLVLLGLWGCSLVHLAQWWHKINIGKLKCLAVQPSNHHNPLFASLFMSWIMHVS